MAASAEQTEFSKSLSEFSTALYQVIVSFRKYVKWPSNQH